MGEEKMIIGVGSKNPVKIDAVCRLVASRGLAAEVKSFAVSSGVSAMPMTDAETRRGSINRALRTLEADESVQIGIGLEGGADSFDDGMFLVNWGALADRNGKIVTAGGARIRLPAQLADGVRGGTELGDLADEYAHEQEVSTHGGAIGVLTCGMVTRSDLFFHIMKLLDGIYRHDRARSG
jgi:inosine/xanthosine triphosphatase